VGRVLGKVSKNRKKVAKYLQDSGKSDNFAAENDKKQKDVNVERLLLRLLLLLCKQL
jgi:hypothetical protein